MYRPTTRHVSLRRQESDEDVPDLDDVEHANEDDDDAEDDPSEHRRLLDPSSSLSPRHGASASSSRWVDKVEVEHHIIYSRTYHVPQLMLRAWDSSELPLYSSPSRLSFISPAIAPSRAVESITPGQSTRLTVYSWRTPPPLFTHLLWNPPPRLSSPVQPFYRSARRCTPARSSFPVPSDTAGRTSDHGGGSVGHSSLSSLRGSRRGPAR